MKAVLVAAFLAAAAPPAADTPLPQAPAEIAAALADTTRHLHRAIDDWQAGPDADGPTPRPVGLWALHQQRLFLLLTYRPRLGDRARPHLTRQARETLDARRRLVSLTPPTTRPLSSFRTGPPAPAAVLLRHYRAAQRRFGVPWHVLAAVNFVESAFGRLRNRSVSGARGPMQFMPATWAAYGLGGDISDPRDAILGAANYLHANGAPGDEARALFRYNPSSHYVRAISRYAGRIRADWRAFYAYYAWVTHYRGKRIEP